MILGPDFTDLYVTWRIARRIEDFYEEEAASAERTFIRRVMCRFRDLAQTDV